MGHWTSCLVLLVVLVDRSVFAAVPSIGTCPNVRGKSRKIRQNVFYKHTVLLPITLQLHISGLANFDRSRYLGSWYENANVFEFYQIGSTCVRATYTDEGSKIGVLNEQVNAM